MTVRASAYVRLARQSRIVADSTGRTTAGSHAQVCAHSESNRARESRACLGSDKESRRELVRDAYKEKTMKRRYGLGLECWENGVGSEMGAPHLMAG
eukprot:6211187-Pleurochrysis_carterae.AAC.3